MSIISLKDGHVVWPLEVVRKNDWKLDIEVGSEEMKKGHKYFVRISNNDNLSPNGATEFKVKKGSGKAILLAPLALPVSQSLLPILTKAIQERLTPSQIEKELKNMFPGLDRDEIRRLKDTVLDDIKNQIQPVDDVTKKMIKKKKFVTQMDARVCPICLEAQENHSPGLPPSEYHVDDPDAPRIPLHINCRCTFDIVFNEEFEASFEDVRDIVGIPNMLKAVKVVSIIS